MGLIGDHFLKAAQIESLRPRVTFTMCHLWLIRLTDGSELKFASHDKPIEFGGRTYLPMGPTPQNMQTAEAAEDSDYEIFGFLSHETIRPRDILLGRFDGATVLQYVIDWNRPWIWTKKHKWWIKSIAVDGDMFKADVGGLEQFLEIKTGRYYEKECEKAFTGTECKATGFSLTSQTVSAVPSSAGGSINGITRDARAMRVVTGQIPDLPTGVFPPFAYGSVNFLSGSNKGKSIQIADSQYVEQSPLADSYLDITLSTPAPFPIRVSDTLDIFSGCDGSFTTCKLVYDNTINFGGIHRMPTTEDQYVQPELDNTQEV